MIVCFDVDLSADDIIAELDNLAVQNNHKQVWFRKATIDFVFWYFFSDEPITNEVVIKELELKEGDLK